MTERTEREYQEFLEAVEEFFEWAGQEDDVDQANKKIFHKKNRVGCLFF